jgi:steroid 5-alpha reductase family enzyme
VTPAAKRTRYRADPAFRAEILASNLRSRVRHASAYRERMNWLAATICRLRDSIDARLQHAARLEKRLMKLTKEREELKARNRARATI